MASFKYYFDSGVNYDYIVAIKLDKHNFLQKVHIPIKKYRQLKNDLRGGYKWPKLIELAECLRIKTDDINLHDSSADVELTKRCFLYLLEKKFYQL